MQTGSQRGRDDEHHLQEVCSILRCQAKRGRLRYRLKKEITAGQAEHILTVVRTGSCSDQAPSCILYLAEMLEA